MATLSHYPPTLHVTSADDDMEIASQAEPYDQDIDIDLDVPSDNLGDGDLLLDDARSEGGNISVSNDQEMLQDIDDAMNEEDHEHGEMHEGVDDDLDLATADQDQADEHLADADFDNTIHEPGVAVQDATELGSYEQEQVHIADFDVGDVSQYENAFQSEDYEPNPDNIQILTEDFEATSKEPLLDDVAQHDPVQREDFEPGFEESRGHLGINAADELQQTNPVAVTDESIVSPTAGSSVNQQVQQTEVSNDSIAEVPNADTKLLEQTSQDSKSELVHDDGQENRPSLDETTDDQPYYEALRARDEQANSHPIVVSYENARFSLFPPTNEDESTQFLLSDSSLCSRSLVDLLHACREVLGDDISDEQELRLYNRELDLEISEESAHAFSTSLAEILEIYVDLHQLDGVEVPEPLEVSLVKKERFTAGLSRLRAAVADGRGMSRLWEDWNEDNETHLHSEGSPDDAEATNEGHGDVLSAEKEDDYDVLEQHTTDDHRENVGSEEDAEDLESEGPPIDREETSDEAYDAPEQPEDPAQARTGQNEAEALDDEHQRVEDDAGQHIEDGVKLKKEIEHEPTAHEEPEDLIDYSDDEQGEKELSSQSSTVAGDDGAVNEGNASTLASQGKVASEVRDSPAAEQEYRDLVEFDQLDPEQPDLNLDYGGAVHGRLEHNDEQQDLSGEDNTQVLDLENIGWLDPPAEAAVTDDIEDSAYPDEDHGHDEDWDHLVDNGDQRGGETTLLANEQLDDHNVDSVVADPTPEAGVEDHDLPTEAVDDEAFDEEDEITFDDGEADLGFEATASHEEQPSVSRQPSESPTGKRSFTEHLGGEVDEEGSDPEAKRLRST